MSHQNMISTKNERATRPRRRRALTVLGSLMAFYEVRESAAFTSTPGIHSRPPMHQQQQFSNTPLHMAKKQPLASTAPPPKRLSPSEEKVLLQQAAEHRRLQTLEKEMAMREKNNLPLLSVRAEAAGYGTDLDAYEAAMDAGHKAREALVTRNMGLVHYCVKNIVGSSKMNSLSNEDLVQEGVIGLARAVEKYNPDMGTKFSTYAVYWIRAAVFRCIAERDDMLRVPSHVSDAVRKATRAATRLGLELDGSDILSTFGANTAWKEAHASKALAVEAGLTDKQLAQAMLVKERRRKGGYTSFEPWMQTKNSIVQDVSTTTTSETSSPDVEQLKTILSRYLRPKEMEALSWRYGLISSQQKQQEREEAKQSPKPFRDYLAESEEEIFGPDGILTKQDNKVSKSKPAALPKRGKWGEAMTFTEVGKRMSISAEYGRRLCNTALDKLRAAAQEGSLEPALLF